HGGAPDVILAHLDIQSRRCLVPLLRTRPHAFCVLHSYGPDRTTAFGILPGARSLPDAPACDAGEIRFGVCPAAYLSSSGPRQRASPSPKARRARGPVAGSVGGDSHPSG